MNHTIFLEIGTFHKILTEELPYNQNLVVPFQVVTFSLHLTKAKIYVMQDKRLSKSSHCSHHLTYFSQFCFPDEKCVVTICKGGNFIGYNKIQANDKDKCAYSQE